MTQCFLNLQVNSVLRCVTHMDLLRVALMVPFQTDMYDMFTLLTPLAGTIELKGRMRGRE